MFGSLIKKPTTEVAKPSVPSVSKPDDLIIKSSGSGMLHFQTKNIKIMGKIQKVDAYALMRMIKRVTQNIGEYKDVDTPYATYIITALRKARSDMVSDLESHFNIKWVLQEGQSVFVI